MPKTTKTVKPAITARDILVNAVKPAPSSRAKRAAVSAKLEKRAIAKRNRAEPRQAEPTPGQINAWRAWRPLLTQRLPTASAADAKSLRAKIAEYDRKLRAYPAAEKPVNGPRL